MLDYSYVAPQKAAIGASAMPERRLPVLEDPKGDKDCSNLAPVGSL